MKTIGAKIINWSILICSVHDRIRTSYADLVDKLLLQIEAKPIEIVSIFDNKVSSVGEKRNALVSISRGEYISFIDDDDDISDDYVSDIYREIVNEKPNVITYYTQVCDLKYPVKYSLNPTLSGFPGHSNDFSGFPSHTCTWKRAFYLNHKFPSANQNEDRDWAYYYHWNNLVRTGEVEIKKVLYYYNYDKVNSHCSGSKYFPSSEENISVDSKS